MLRKLMSRVARFFIPSLFAFAQLPTLASPTGKDFFNVKDLSICWEPVQNEYQDRPQWSLNALIITNHGHDPFPAGGWKMYFNSARLIQPVTVTGNARISLVNGDLFSLMPAQSFAEIRPGDSIRIEYVAEEPVINFTDGPEGFYLVWDAKHDRGFALGAFSVKPFKPDYTGLVTPEIIYNQNKDIRTIPTDHLIKIFPTPTAYRETGGFFTLNLQAHALVLSTDKRFQKESLLLTSTLETLFGKKLSAPSDPNPGNLQFIGLHYKEGLHSEGYELDIKSNSIEILASEPAGMFYGIQSLKSLMPPIVWSRTQRSIDIPTVEVKDEPRFGLRGFMLDVGRNFQSKQEVMKILDIMALYKLNVFHFHLTEDEGWRIALPSLPELTEIGSQRGHTLDSRHFLPPSHGSGPDTGAAPGSGFYSRADYIEILHYANDRHILVVPEIETPGHARAAVKSMNARYERLIGEGKKEEASRYLLYDRNDSSQYSSSQYWRDNIMDVSLPSTYAFIETVIDDTVHIYKEAGVPLNTIQFGGDEVPANVWEKSPAYETLKASHPEIKSTADLWYYYYGRVNKLLKARGLFLSGWEEMGLRKTMLDGRSFYVPNPDFTGEHLQTEVWNNTFGDGNEDLAYRLANAGYKVMLSCVSHLYFDMANEKSFDEPGYYWGAFTDIEKPFSFIPYDYFKNATVDKNGVPLNRNIFVGKQRLTDYGKENIIGIQSALWEETVKTPERLEYMLLPRLLAFAERAWSKDPDWATTTDTAKAKMLYAEAWSAFLQVLGERELPRLDYYNGGYRYRLPKPGILLQNGLYLANIQFPGMVIRYTTNGKEPDAKSKVYTGGIEYDNGSLRLRAFDTRGRGGNTASIN